MTRFMRVNRFAGTGGEDYALRHPWPEGVFVQGGHSGVVIGPDGYTTAYFEAFPETFIRGEGSSLELAEDAAWEKFLKQGSCPGHEYEPRGYKNGLGFCKHCSHTKSKAFTPEDLGLTCVDCGVYTYWSRVDDDFYCPLHEPVRNANEIEYKWKRDHDPSYEPSLADLLSDD